MFQSMIQKLFTLSHFNDTLFIYGINACLLKQTKNENRYVSTNACTNEIQYDVKEW